MSFSREKKNTRHLDTFKELLDNVFISIDKSDFDQCAYRLKKIVYHVSGRRYRNTLLTGRLIGRTYEALDRFIDSCPDNKPEPYLLKAVFLARQYRVAEALQSYEDIHHHFPWYKEAYYRHKKLLNGLKEILGNFSTKDKDIIDRLILKYSEDDQVFSGDVEFELWKNGGQGEHSRFDLISKNRGTYYQPGAQNSLFKERLQTAWLDRCSAKQGSTIKLLSSLIESVCLMSLTSDDVIALLKAVAGFRAIYSDGMKANLLLADLYGRLGFSKEACNIYQTLEKNHPASAEAFTRHESLLRSQGKHNEADQIQQLQKALHDQCQALAEARHNQSQALVEKLLVPAKNREVYVGDIQISANKQHNWQPKVPLRGQQGYDRFQGIKKSFEKSNVKTNDRLTKIKRPVSRASSQAGLLARFGHYDWQPKMAKEQSISEWQQQGTSAPESQKIYVHPNGRPDAVGQREAYSRGFSYTDVAKNKSQWGRKAFKK